MPKRSRTKPTGQKPRPKKQEPKDANQTAFDALQRVLELTEGTEGKNPLAVALGRLGGLKGGRARADKLTKAELRESARKAAQARWKNQSKA